MYYINTLVMPESKNHHSCCCLIAKGLLQTFIANECLAGQKKVVFRRCKMISNSLSYATLPAKDMKRAEKFYEEKLGLQPFEKEPDGGILYRAKNGCSSFLVYPSQFAGTAQNTAMTFVTENIELEMKELRSKGVVFEEYNMPGLKTVNGLATMEQFKAAWFKDTEGNILALNQMPHHN